MPSHISHAEMSSSESPVKDSQDTLPLLPIVAIGASAGGLSALEAFFNKMPSDSGMAFVVIQHLSPDFKSLMDDLLRRHTEMAIYKVKEGIRMEPNAIYLIPPKSLMTVKDGHLHLTEKRETQYFEMPIDIFFSSLAEEAGAVSAGIILSGTGSDGSRGIRDLKLAGGLILVQDVETAQFDGMPRSAIATGAADYILPPEEMPRYLVQYLGDSSGQIPRSLPGFSHVETHGEFHPVIEILNQKYRLDFSSYKPPTVLRRIQRRMELNDIVEVDSYTDLLHNDGQELEALYRDLLIGVTEFLRDPKAFEGLTRKVFPALFREKGSDAEIRVWSAGCATGEEAYSLAILLFEEAEKTQFNGTITLFASDVHPSSIQFASQGRFEASRLKNLKKEYLEKYFQKDSDGVYTIVPRIRRSIVFAPSNVISDPPFTRMDLICCRNLLIYLQPEIQEKVLALFHFSLKPNGFLFLGSSEGLGKLDGEFETVDRNAKIYRKLRDVRLAVEMPSVGGRKESLLTALPASSRLSISIDRQLVEDYDLLLRAYMPPGILVDGNRRILHCFGDASRLIRVQEGRFENDVLEQVDPDLRIPMGTALYRTEKAGTAITSRGVKVGKEDRRYDLKVEPLKNERLKNVHYFISLEEAEAHDVSVDVGRVEKVDHLSEEEIPQFLQQRINEMELELQSTKENLQATVEELQTTNEELMATNEELMASNEELQSTNEELHSVNEELYTVNSEFESKNVELQALNQDHDNLLNSTQAGTIYLDSNLRIRKFNPAIKEIFKLLPQDVGRPIDHIAYRLDNQARLLKDVRQVLEGGEPIEKEIKAEEDKWLFKRVLPFVNEKGEIQGVVLTFTDITRIKVAEEQLATANRELESKVEKRTREFQTAKEEAEAANAAKSLFLANMSHELRTPLTTIFGMIDLLEESSMDEQQVSYLSFLRNSSVNLLKIIEDILDFSSIEAGKLTLKPELLSLNIILDETLDIYRVRAADKGLLLVSSMDEGIPRILSLDGQRLKQVLFNLLTNAIKFTEKGTIGLSVSVDSHREGQDVQLHFVVSDTGIGIPAGGGETLFEPFSQGDGSITRRYGGTGLGLAICRQLVDMMGGRIWFEANPGGGTRFHFTINVELPQYQFANDFTEDTANKGYLPHLKILLAEDDPVSRGMFRIALEDQGHACVTARDGEEALEILSGEKFDLLLFDISMPVMDGKTALKKLRGKVAGHPNRGIPAIALTAHALESQVKSYLEAGFSEVLTKPLSLNELRRTISRYALAGIAEGDSAIMPGVGG